jgi:dihydroorotase (multifunctional complex type)
MELDLVVRGRRLCDGSNEPFGGDLGVRGGKIAAVAEFGSLDAGVVVDAGDDLVMPGAIDPHVHIGHGDEHAKEFWSEGRAALQGGVTTIMTFYRKYPFEYLESVPELLTSAGANSPVDFVIHLPLYTQQNLAELAEYHRRLGIRSFKFFPGIRGEDAAKMTDLPYTGPMLPIDDYFVYDGMSRVSEIPGAIVLYHAENPEIIAGFASRIRGEGRNDLRAWCDSRPAFGEAQSVQEALYWQRITGCALYLVHMSSEECVGLVAAEKESRPEAPIFVETCPQYLSLTCDAEVGTLAKMSPPLRSESDAKALWEGIRNGTVDTIGTDHGAFMRQDKVGAWVSRSGFPGLPTMVPVVATFGLKRGEIDEQTFVNVLSTNVAKIFGLYPRKGSFRVGADADIAVLDLDSERVVDPTQLEGRSDFSVFEGLSLSGWPRAVIRRGELVLENGQFHEISRGVGVHL